MENLLLPSKVEFVPGDSPNKGSLVVSPCFYGYGTTLGNTLRRVLLSSLPGAAVEALKIKGVQHEFSSADGLKEDVIDIILNLKQLAVRVFTEEPVTLHISKKGPGLVTGADIEANSNAEVMNPELVLATLTSSKPFEMDLIVGRGRGFRPVEEKDKKHYDLGTIVIDSIYTPIKDVGYNVEYTRVGDITNYEKLTLNIETNGTISPGEAVKQTVQIIMDHFSVISGAANEMVLDMPMPVVAKAEESEEEDEEKKVKKAKKVSKKK
ncbi:MAG: DNA-directed RNA polymerase subunit alpha [Candidatus Magasanikbacteria bacterium RIFOXYD2_FULL_39_9]|uniref:DNA-directed RNA polymerase subunit alpha n=1 Tax=Candidatus Magasanikbacteria bacterium RIFOXYD1_FULL_40_23 TaxID=1798705 RepID=A0A1F6PAR1_9BACT|nr:MAG: DNA-directed RNA polymerase subunit alpha [Candidatus Magasanikbacteria bacterium RIFOXYD2_FULL_39_9]OGH93252.1 MAG: DNA-directed RNA polymerase subunit alpha [Candidatus Magasanikbacteria bacterium RIFOXYD1_FULL_40_23]